MKFLGVIFVYLSCCLAQTYAQGVSQERLPGETFEEAVERVTPRQEGIKPPFPSSSPYAKKVLIKNMDLSKITEVNSLEELEMMFELIRDTRFLTSKSKPGFSRRISWLYPDDGCFARAALAAMKIYERKIPRPLKIFAFGNLEINTPYSSSGTVTWWYHVALVVKYMDSYYVLDPALSPRKPVLFDEWYQTMGNTANLKGVICETYTYDAFGNCTSSKKDYEANAYVDEAGFLEKEWTRLKELGLDPIRLLGAHPPWLEFN